MSANILRGEKPQSSEQTQSWEGESYKWLSDLRKEGGPNNLILTIKS